MLLDMLPLLLLLLELPQLLLLEELSLLMELPLLAELSPLMELMAMELSLLLVLPLLVAYSSAKLTLKPILPFIIMEDHMEFLYLLPNAKPPPRDSAVKSLSRLLAPFPARCALQFLVKSVFLFLRKSATLS